MPEHTFKDDIEHSKVPVGKNVTRDEDAIRLIFDSLTALLVIERKILDALAEVSDEGTNSMMSDFITEQQKTIWMMAAWLAEEI